MFHSEVCWCVNCCLSGNRAVARGGLFLSPYRGIPEPKEVTLLLIILCFCPDFFFLCRGDWETGVLSIVFFTALVSALRFLAESRGCRSITSFRASSLLLIS